MVSDEWLDEGTDLSGICQDMDRYKFRNGCRKLYAGGLGVLAILSEPVHPATGGYK